MLKVKDLLKHDYPPTTASAKLRREHTIGNLKHDLNHIKGHADNIPITLEKLHTVDSKKAHKEAKKTLKTLGKHLDQIKGWAKDSKSAKYVDLGKK